MINQLCFSFVYSRLQFAISAWGGVAIVAIGKARAACVQNLWQQATIEFTRHDYSVVACSSHIYLVLFFAHIPFVVNRAFSTTPAEWLQHHNNLLHVLHNKIIRAMTYSSCKTKTTPLCKELNLLKLDDIYNLE